MIFSRIAGTGSYLPERIVSNAELARKVDTSDEWIASRTGIRERHIARDDESTGDMARHALATALEAAGIGGNDLDLIILATSTPDLIYPSTACLVQRDLGITNNAAAFDVQAVCSGFLYALSIADKFISTGAARRAAVIGADANSKILDWSDRATCVLFGDGAGAVILEAGDQPGIYGTLLHADGRYAEMLEVPSGVSRKGGEPYIRMRGAEVFKFAVNAMEQLVDESLKACGRTRAEIDWLVPHQANERIISAAALKIGLPMSKVVLTLEHHGNTSAASIPLALDTAIRDGRIKRGELLLFEAVGGGFTWASALVRY